MYNKVKKAPKELVEKVQNVETKSLLQVHHDTLFHEFIEYFEDYLYSYLLRYLAVKNKTKEYLIRLVKLEHNSQRMLDSDDFDSTYYFNKSKRSDDENNLRNTLMMEIKKHITAAKEKIGKIRLFDTGNCIRIDRTRLRESQTCIINTDTLFGEKICGTSKYKLLNYKYYSVDKEDDKQKNIVKFKVCIEQKITVTVEIVLFDDTIECDFTAEEVV